MLFRRPIPALPAASLIALFGCGGGDEAPAGRLPETPRSSPPAAVLRLPRDGGTARLYRIPGLAESGWRQSDRLPALQRVIGADLEQRIVYALDTKANLIGLDLESRRVRTYLSKIRDATLGPDGAVYAVDADAAVTQLLRRNPVRFRTKLAGASRELFASMQGAIISLPAKDGGEAVALGANEPYGRAHLPDGDAAATTLGDLVAIATDSAVVLFEPQAKQPVSTIDIQGARAVAFSPSGHRLYVARATGDLVVFDRFGRVRLGRFKLPGSARELRNDTYGVWLLARPETGDSVWVIELATGRLAGTVATAWGADLPAVAGDGTLLVRSDRDVRALDLGRDRFPVTATVKGGATDLWLPLAWLPVDEQEQLAADADSAEVADTGAVPQVYLQVSSSRNPSWADELATKLANAGLPASVLPPRRGEEAYRVVLGPYATREQAEAAAKSVGMPSFVITPQDLPAQ